METCEEIPEEKDTSGIQEDIPDTQVEDSIEGQRSGEEISVDKNCLLGIEFLFDRELFGKPGKPKVRLTRAEKRRHNKQWTEQLRSSQETGEKQRQKDQKQQDMTERNQHALELDTTRQRSEAWMKKAEDLMKWTEDLANENELLNKEPERREVEGSLRRGKKEMEEQEIRESDTSIVGDAEPVNPTKREPGIKEGLRRKQKEAQKEPSPANSDSDATGTTLEKQTRKNMKRRRKASFLDDRRADSIPERRSSCNDEQKGKAYERSSYEDEQEGKAHGRRGSNHDSESGKEASDNGKGPDHGEGEDCSEDPERTKGQDTYQCGLRIPHLD